MEDFISKTVLDVSDEDMKEFVSKMMLAVSDEDIEKFINENIHFMHNNYQAVMDVIIKNDKDIIFQKFYIDVERNQDICDESYYGRERKTMFKEIDDLSFISVNEMFRKFYERFIESCDTTANIMEEFRSWYTSFDIAELVEEELAEFVESYRDDVNDMIKPSTEHDDKELKQIAEKYGATKILSFLNHKDTTFS